LKAEDHMDKAAIICKLHEITDDYLLVSAKWPMEGEAIATFWKTLKELGLEEDVPGTDGHIQSTALGRELSVDLMIAFVGAHELWEIPFILESNGYIEESEAEELWSGPLVQAERMLHQYVLRAYRQFCNHSKFLN
jgi:hypothetical protein